MTRSLPNNSRDLISKLQSDGWYEVAQKGSHRHFKHPDLKGKLTVPHPKRSIPVGTLRAIYRMAEWI